MRKRKVIRPEAYYDVEKRMKDRFKLFGYKYVGFDWEKHPVVEKVGDNQRHTLLLTCSPFDEMDEMLRIAAIDFPRVCKWICKKKNYNMNIFGENVIEIEFLEVH